MPLGLVEFAQVGVVQNVAVDVAKDVSMLSHVSRKQHT